MWKFIVRRIATTLTVLAGVSVITFGIVLATPGDPARTILRQQLGGRTPSEEAVQQFREEQGLDEPLPVQYVDWITDVLQGDLGTSYYSETPVIELIVDNVYPTFELAVAGMAIALLIAIPAGVISAVHKGTVLDYGGQVSALLGLSMPNFWLGYLLMMIFALWLGLFPVSGVGGLEYLVLPAVTLGTGVAAIVMRLLRSSMLEVLDEEYIQTARSKGLRERIVIYKHALRNALIPVVTIVGLQFGFLLNGAVVVEIVFQRPGLGDLLLDAIFSRNYPVVQGMALLIAVLFVLSNLAVDIAYRYIDPRITFEGAAE